jgi:rsbT co-antagonist protein RsbR
MSVFALKDALIELFDLGDGDVGKLRDLIGFSQVVDQLGLYTFETYAHAREELISEQGEQLLELSTPVVKLWEGVVAVPLVGTLDSARAQVVMEKLLQTLVDTGSTYAIIDITGVPAVDTQVAQHILKTVVAARLMGAECVISGIRPQIAQTIVALGIEFGDIATKATLADALVHAMRVNGVDIVRRMPGRES